MYDTGNSMFKLREKIASMGPASLRVCIAFHKKTSKNLKWGYFADYVGFLVPDKFLVGYGLDYNERFRDVFHLCVLN